MEKYIKFFLIGMPLINSKAELLSSVPWPFINFSSKLIVQIFVHISNALFYFLTKT